jgi:hypothetical protein
LASILPLPLYDCLFLLLLLLPVCCCRRYQCRSCRCCLLTLLLLLLLLLLLRVLLFCVLLLHRHHHHQGVLFEDLDALAGNVSWRHAVMGNGVDCRPPMLVTAAVDEVRNWCKW